MTEYLIALWPSVLKVLPDLLLSAWISIAVFCRFNKMGPHTSNLVASQYGALFAGSVCATAFRFIPDLREYALTALLLGVVVFLMLSAKRWSGKRAPEGTDKPLRRIDDSQLTHVVGGVKK